jgi:hypothetical protein
VMARVPSMPMRKSGSPFASVVVSNDAMRAR